MSLRTAALTLLGLLAALPARADRVDPALQTAVDQPTRADKNRAVWP